MFLEIRYLIIWASFNKPFVPFDIGYLSKMPSKNNTSDKIICKL